MSGSTTTATQVAAAYTAILRVAPPGGASGAYATSIAAQINQGLLSLGNFESSLINLDQTVYTTLAALVTIDAFYNATPSSATLTTVATATSGTSFETAAELHNLGYSDANVWTILGAGWGADPTSNFYALYNGQATGNTNDYSTFINNVYLREFGSLPTAANLQNLLNDIPGLTQLLSGGGHTATPIQIMGGLYGYLLYTAQVNNIGALSSSATAFLALAATDEATTPGSSAGLYGPELLTQHLTPPTQTSIFLTTAADNVTGTAVYGSLTPFSINGVGPTLNADDIVNGSPGSTNNTLTISDDYGTGNDTIPLGTTINNVQNIVLQTAGNAGGGSALFDTTPYTAVNNVVINSSGYLSDFVKVSGTSALTVNHQSVAAGSVQTYGGTTVSVTDNAPASSGAAITIGSTSIAGANPSGAVVANAVGAFVTVFGGTTVTVNQSAIGGGITIGTAGYSVSNAEPTGAVTVNAPATSTVQAGTPIAVFGGTNATLTSGGGAITIGAQVGTTVFAPTGNDTVVDNAALPLTSNYLTGANFFAVPVLAPAGSLPIYAEVAVNVLGGQTINVTTNAGGVTVGAPAATAYNGTVLIPGVLPSGNVTINDTADLAPSTGTVIPTTSGGSVAANTPVSVYGGANVSVTDSGSPVTVGNNAGTNVVAPTGTVTVADTAQVVHDGIVNKDDNVVTDIGGTAVTVTTNAGDVAIGTAAATAGTEPTGNITVTDTGTDSVTAYGGVNDTIAATNGFILIGAVGGVAATNPTGNVTASETGLFTGDTGIVNSSITVNGGVSVTATTTGGNVAIGTAKTPVTGVVSVTDTQVGASSDSFSVIGGASAAGATTPSVSITSTATSGNITVGIAGTAALTAAGTALKTPGDYANGTIAIVDESLANTASAGATNVFGTGAISVNTNGATAVTIAGGGSAIVTDEQTTLSTGGASAGSPIGTSTLTSVSLDGVGGVVTTANPAPTPSLSSVLTSGALVNVSVLDSAKGNTTNVTINTPVAAGVTAVPLNLTLGNDAAGTAITDAKATTITITTPTGSTASNSFELAAAAATALVFNNSAPVTLAAATLAPITSIDNLVKTVTISGSGSVTLPDFTTGTTADGALTAITGTGSSGAITVGGINVFKTAFTGGSGSDTVWITNNPANPPAGSSVQKIAAGSGASNTLVANYAAGAADLPLHTVSQISGFTTLQLGPLADSTLGDYDAGGFGSLSIGQTANSVVFSDIGAGTENLTITAPQVGGSITYLLNDPTAESDALAITIGSTATTPVAITSNILLAPDLITSKVTDKGTVGTISINSTDPASFTGTNVVALTDAIPGLSGAPNAGATTISASGNAALTVTYQPAGAPVTLSSISTITDSDTATVDMTGVALGPNGVSVTGGPGLIKAYGSGILTGSADNTKAVDTFTSGSGGAQFTLGSGGGWNTGLASKTAPLGSNDSGNETVNLSASTAVSDTINVGPGVVSINNGTGVGGVTGFQAVASAKAADVIGLTGTGAVGSGDDGAGVSGYSVMSNAAANNTSPVGLQNVYAFVAQGGAGAGITKDLVGLDPTSLLQSLTFSSSNGVITFGAVDGSNINQFTPTQLLVAAEAIVTEEAFIASQDQVAVFTAAFAGLPANTYIVASDFFNTKVTTVNGQALTANVNHIYGATALELNGVTSGITGFGATAALNAVELSGASQVLPGPAGATVFYTLGHGGVGNLGTTNGTVYNDIGFSEDTLGANGGKGGPAGASSVNTYNNLGAYAQIDITAAPVGGLGGLTVGAQIGTQGSDSFLLNMASAPGPVTLGTVTVTSDDLVTVVLTPGVTDTIGSFSDAGGTVASLIIGGAAGASTTGSLVLSSAIADTALTSIDAHLVTGALGSLLAPFNVTETVTINGALGGDTILASGNADTITIGSTANQITGNVSIQANAAGDTVTLTHEGAITAFIGAASGPDTLTVDAGTNNLGGTFAFVPPSVAPGPGSTFTTSLGAGDTVNLHSGAAFGAAVDLAWVGSGTTVNLGTSTAAWGAGASTDTATVAVMGDATGATSGNSPAMTTITGFSTEGANGNLYLQFDNNPNALAHGVPLTANTSAPAFVWAGGSAAVAQVNEASATSLANALDIAASQNVMIDAKLGAGHTTVTHGVVQINASTGLSDWFQYGGNTYIVESMNSTAAPAAHAALATNDVVVELTGLVNVSAQITAGHLHFV